MKPSTPTSPVFSADDHYLFNEGTHYRLYQHLGAHMTTHQGVSGVRFAVWAPNANYVAVMGSFNDWRKDSHSMVKLDDSGIWQLFIPAVQAHDLYKFYIESIYDDYTVEKADPFAFYQEIAPKTASIVWHSDYQWHDASWLAQRHQRQQHCNAWAIYEVHLGSWQRDNGRMLTYRELAPRLAAYVKQMNFTHVELLPITEHPYYASWGYQTLGYFAPSSRYGNPDDFKYLVDYLHQQQIGIILDWVPSHFPTDKHGLAFFDGTHLYEHADPRKGFHPDWKSAIFNYGCLPVKSFLISSALFWLDHYHIDAIRVDAVASMLYLDYSRAAGEWLPNEHGGHENLEAIAFLQDLNKTLYYYHPDIQTFAEESTAWPKVSAPIEQGGLGFGFKWDMGWMHDTLSYISTEARYRCHHQRLLTFRMMYAFSENFVLSLSHDECVHGKGSLFTKAAGDNDHKFANLRLLYGYMYGLPGKKLLFMGNEFGQWREWNHDASLDWHLLQQPLHQGLQAWVRELNTLYQNEPSLHQLDHDPQGFQWLVCDEQTSVLAFTRQSRCGAAILVMVNGTPVIHNDYQLTIAKAGNWQLITSSSHQQFGGEDGASNYLTAKPLFSSERDYSLTVKLPGLSVNFYKWIGEQAND